MNNNNYNASEVELKGLLEEALKFEFNIPINIKIFLYALVLVIISIICYIVSNGDKINIIYSNYKWYYIIAIFNIVNVICILYYYQYKTKYLKLNRTNGPKGEKGGKGDRGKFITCSFCDYNLYVQRTKRYSLVVNIEKSYKLMESHVDTFSKMYNETGISYNSLGIELESLDFNTLLNMSGITDFESDVIQNQLNLSSSTTLNRSINLININTVETYVNLINHISITSLRFILNNSIKDINRIITKGLTDYPGSFYNLTGGKVGFFSLGDSVFNNAVSTRLNGFLVNGDIRNPINFNKKAQFITYVKGEFDEINQELYTVWEPEAPENYVSMGQLIQSGDKPPIPNIVACVNKNCVKNIGVQELELVFLNYSINQNTDVSYIDNIIQTYEITNNLDFFVNMFTIHSVWRTTMNTMYIKTCDDSDLINSSVIANILGDNEEYYDEFGTVNTDSSKMVKDKLKSFKLPKIINGMFIRLYLYIFNSTKMVARKKYFYESEYYDDLIRKKNELNYKVKNNIIKRPEYNELIKNLIELEERKPLETITKKFEESINQIPSKIDKIKNLLDLLELVIPGGLESEITVNADKQTSINQIQIELLKICRALFPPPVKNYVIKNECLSFTRISLDRRMIVKKLNNLISTIQAKFKTYKTNPSEYCGEGWVGVVNFKEMTETYLTKYLNHLTPDPVKHILNLEFDLFPDSRLKVIYEKYNELNDYTDEKCKNINQLE